MFSHRRTLRFSLTLKRRAGFQAYLLTLPCVVLGGLSVLVFSLPPERPDRHALGEYSCFPTDEYAYRIPNLYITLVHQGKGTKYPR